MTLNQKQKAAIPLNKYNKTYRMPRTLTKEGIVKQQIKSYLQFKGWHVKKIVQNAFSDHGLADFFAFKDGVVIFVECKSPNGKQRPEQKQFQQELEEENIIYILADCIEDLQKERI